GSRKRLNTIPSLPACGKAGINCGLLSVDEVHSPVQVVIDLEIVSALRRFVKGFEISDDTLAVEVIKRVGPEGHSQQPITPLTTLERNLRSPESSLGRCSTPSRGAEPGGRLTKRGKYA
ncbi:MAG TPA: hypothetical protein EYP65_08520, partial [Armatimonadetes bacterium]|nr:hypothetical protein [Armatimonadota bacterium]